MRKNNISAAITCTRSLNMLTVIGFCLLSGIAPGCKDKGAPRKLPMTMEESTLSSALQVQHLTTENLINPLGIDIIKPQFSWQLQATERNTLQTAYEIRVAARSSDLDNGPFVWHTNKVSSDQSVGIPYSGKPLVSGNKYYWQVRVWDNHGHSSAWSAPAYWQMGLLHTADWKAQWITPGFKEEPGQPSPIFRKSFNVPKKVQAATAYITAHGLYEAHINGKRVGDAYLTPGWTSYNKRLQYQVYDVTSLLTGGKNAIGVTLGNGWYRGNLVSPTYRNAYGTELALLLQVDITYEDGTTDKIVTDRSWKSGTGSIRYSEIYHGEVIDARLEQPGWTNADFDDSQWSGVKSGDYSKDNLVGTYNEPVKKQELIKPVRIFKTPKGEQVIDYGQNMVGWVVLRVAGNAGDTVTLSHAEVLDKAGNFYTDNLRSAKAQDNYILRGGGEEVFEPHFTWHGFRYVKVTGYTGDLQPANFQATALYSGMQPTGTFTSSDTLVNQLQHNIEWGLKGNFVDIPTDCPQRDERLGWTGDAQVFFRTAAHLYGVNNFFTKWMKDLAADQLPSGSVPFVIPNVMGEAAGSAGWSDAATIIPWNMYLQYGDKRILEEQYASMKKWVDYVTGRSIDHLWTQDDQFGDWLYYSLNDDLGGRSAITNPSLITQCFYAHSTQLLIKAANQVGKKQDAAHYTKLLAKIKEAFLNEYVTPNGALASNTQTAYVLALQFDMLPEVLRPQAADRLVKNIKKYGNHLTTGFLGTPYLCHVLSRFGHTDMAYTLLLQESYPSWLYPVKMGATTIWERWDGIKPDSSFQTQTMNSFNHYAYGAVGDWLYRGIAGIDTDEDTVGYKKIIVKPQVNPKLTHARATYQTYYGQLAAGWKIEGNVLWLDVTIPANTTATIYIPAKRAGDIQENGQPLNDVKGIEVAGNETEYVKVKTGSGTYRFSTSWRPPA